MSDGKSEINSRGLWALAIGETLVWASLFYGFAALLLSWEHDLGWPKTDLTIGFTLAVLTAAIASPFAGRVIDAGCWALAYFPARIESSPSKTGILAYGTGIPAVG